MSGCSLVAQKKNRGSTVLNRFFPRFSFTAIRLTLVPQKHCLPETNLLELFFDIARQGPLSLLNSFLLPLPGSKFSELIG